MAADLIVARPEGLYCAAGDFYIDPWRPVDRAVITHGHSDHARAGHAHYLAHDDSEGVLRARLGADITLQDRKSTRLNSSHLVISYAVFCLKKKKTEHRSFAPRLPQRLGRPSTFPVPAICLYITPPATDR